MVFIYGGTFIMGSTNTSDYGPDYLVERDVVLVCMNYRLGALGNGPTSLKIIIIIINTI